jgi:hypothetical protein
MSNSIVTHVDGIAARAGSAAKFYTPWGISPTRIHAAGHQCEYWNFWNFIGSLLSSVPIAGKSGGLKSAGVLIASLKRRKQRTSSTGTLRKTRN